MSWLVEAFLDEAETATGKRSPIRTDGVHGDEPQKTYTIIKGKPGDPNVKRVLKDVGSRNAAKGWQYGNHKTRDSDGKIITEYDKSKDDKEYKDAKKWAKHQLSFKDKFDKEKVAQAADAKARHDRRHQEAKHETADIIEILQ